MGGFLRDVLDFVTVAASFLWGMPIVILTVLVAVVLTVKTKAFQFRYFGHAFKHTLGNITNKGTEKNRNFSFPCLLCGIGVYDWNRKHRRCSSGNYYRRTRGFVLDVDGCTVWNDCEIWRDCGSDQIS